MPLWLALALPALPLQLAARALAKPTPLAVVEGPAQRPVVAFCNDAARAAGIVPGLKLAAAQALAADLIAVARKPQVEHDALAALAGWAYQYSAHVVVRAVGYHSGLLLEAGGSERLFGGRAALERRIARGLAVLGYRAALACAPTPRAAWWLALARTQGLTVPDATDTAQLQATLDPLPLPLTEWAPQTIDTLHALGLRTLGQVLRLPRAALARRFGTALLADLDCALGHRPDPQPLYVPPERFASEIELPADLTEAAQLLFPAHRLLRLAEGFLRGRDAGATEFAFTARHSARRAQPLAPTPFALRLAAPERNAARLARLLAERLARVRLAQPAVALTLAIERLHPFAAHNASLLPPAPAAQHDTDWLQLAEALHARFGSERVFQLQAVDDHRPEHAWRAVPLAVAPAAPLPAPATPQRPLLILPAPRPLAATDEAPHCDGPLTLVAGPERIEAGWWDHGTGPRRAVARDYFVARNPRGQTLWVYRDLAAPRGWFLHGWFA
ncbi:MAG: Y-family DNA polymerase [Betaproteobacteria bacterium]